MRWLDRLERRAGWLAFPGLFRFYMLLGVLAFSLSWLRPELGAILDFDRTKVFQGEVWRLFTFLFAPDALGTPGIFAVIMLYFAVVIGFLINDSLEAEWGAFRTSMFLYCGYFFLLLGNLLLPATALSGELFYLSAFFAFATLFPKHEFLLFFLIPVQVRFLAILAAVMIVFTTLGNFLLAPFFILAFANYFLWIGPGFLGSRKSAAATAARRQRHEKSKSPKCEAFHQCTVCGRTERDSAHLEFRVGSDGNEYCLDHLDQTGHSYDRDEPSTADRETANQPR